jgi:hypothetical protein
LERIVIERQDGCDFVMNLQGVTSNLQQVLNTVCRPFGKASGARGPIDSVVVLRLGADLP